jgi:hypothetical protein
MSYRITNRRPGPIVIAGSRLHLDPGKSVEVEELSAELLQAAGKGLIEIGDLSAAVPVRPNPPQPALQPPKERLPAPPPAAKKPAKPSPGPDPPQPRKNNFALLKEKLAGEDSREVLETMLANEQRKPYAAMIRKRLRELEGDLP